MCAFEYLLRSADLKQEEHFRFLLKHALDKPESVSLRTATTALHLAPRHSSGKFPEVEEALLRVSCDRMPVAVLELASVIVHYILRILTALMSLFSALCSCYFAFKANVSRHPVAAFISHNEIDPSPISRR